MKVASVAFNGSHHQYDYLCLFDVKVGDNVVVDTKRGEATVIVVAVKDHSDRATAQIKRVVQPDINTLF